MQQLEAVFHPARLQLLQPLQNLRDRQAELRAVAARRLPAAAAAGRELHAHADVRPHADLFGVLEDQVELGVFLDDRDDVPADLLRQHGQLDELGVLEAVADDRRVVVGERGDGDQLGLRARFEPEVERPAEVEDLFDDLPLLVHLDGVDADVLAGVFVLGDGRLKGVVNVLQPVLQDVAEANQRRQADAAKLEMIDQLLQIDRPARLLRRMDLDVAVLADGEVSLPPAGDLVHLSGIDGGPGFSDVVCGTRGHRLSHAAHMIRDIRRPFSGSVVRFRP